MRLSGNSTNEQLPISTQPTVAFSNSPQRKSPSPQRKSSLIWILLISLISLGMIISAVGLVFWIKSFSKIDEAQKTTPLEAKSTPNNSAVENTKENTASPEREKPAANENSSNGEKTIVDEIITVEKNEHKAFAFQVTDNSTMIRGQAELVEGEKFQAYVLLKDAYDTFIADSTYEIIGFNGKRGEIVKVNEFLSADKFVLIVENKSDKPITLKIKMFLKETS